MKFPVGLKAALKSTCHDRPAFSILALWAEVMVLIVLVAILYCLYLSLLVFDFVSLTD